ncbi:MAG: tetratricopeptide repeat protein, partial [Candidatus Marithrix sp.]|nr:tetratricopeptide repeat protein [Candidatus Marithrix sp.]
VGSHSWITVKDNVAQQLFNTGHYTEAAHIYNEILNSLGQKISYERCITLGRLGRCFGVQGLIQKAVNYYQQELTELDKLEQSNKVKSEKSKIYDDLANTQTYIGCYEKAKQFYQQSLLLKKQIGDLRNIVISEGQLGNLALFQGFLAEAEQRYKTALGIFQNLKEPRSEAITWHQLGRVYQTGKLWENAEYAYRQAAKIDETQGNLQSASQTWNNLGIVTEKMGKWLEAEAWYRKAIEGKKITGDIVSLVKSIFNLANLLQNHHNRLSEAQQLVDQALAIDGLDPETSEIWKIYHILAQISDKQGNTQEARKNRHLSRESKANFAGTRYELKQKYSQLILAVARCENVETALQRYGEGTENLKTVIQQILAGERDVEKLCEPLTFYDAPIITAILEGIKNPESLKWFEEN